MRLLRDFNDDPYDVYDKDLLPPFDCSSFIGQFSDVPFKRTKRVLKHLVKKSLRIPQDPRQSWSSFRMDLHRFWKEKKTNKHHEKNPESIGGSATSEKASWILQDRQQWSRIPQEWFAHRQRSFRILNILQDPSKLNLKSLKNWQKILQNPRNSPKSFEIQHKSLKNRHRILEISSKILQNPRNSRNPSKIAMGSFTRTWTSSEILQNPHKCPRSLETW